MRRYIAFYIWKAMRVRSVRRTVLALLGLLALMLAGVPLAPVCGGVALVFAGLWAFRVWERARRRRLLELVHGEVGASVVEFVLDRWADLLPRLGLALDQGRPGPTGDEVWRASLSKEEHTRLMVRLAEAEPVVVLPELVSVRPSAAGPVFAFRPVAGVPSARYLASDTLDELRHHWAVARVSARDAGPGLLEWTARISDPLAPTSVISDWPVTGDLFRWNAALGEDGVPVSLPLSHTLCVGGTGSGKGSVLWGVVNHLRPWVSMGRALLYGIDPKRQEIRSCSEVFQQVAYRPEDWAALLSDLVEELERRKDLPGRDFVVSKAQPLIMLAIDEYAALGALDTDKKRREQTSAHLLLLLSQGRSVGMFVLALVQSGLKQYASERDWFPTRIGLRLASDVETDMVLGEGASDRGAACHLIPPASQANQYSTAGIGYLTVETDPAPVRVRFPYTPDQTLVDWAAEAEYTSGTVAAI
ncbi:FtsK/SpoIIIE domain-containing protein [Streptomyces sp. SID3343]|uniref:type IV secretory system conjugative DNA transfer family protein n=1 Tax=Streptomyces sp. SID3343 TaxID=2690260 RepID=UPI0013708E52|nr:FtsK/SpoIIIE domain-containing protein [Streptomyces sp. SID3343]MYW00707.1 hypothetical protein [Streptomyces sp. SID3343]